MQQETIVSRFAERNGIRNGDDGLCRLLRRWEQAQAGVTAWRERERAEVAHALIPCTEHTLTEAGHVAPAASPTPAHEAPPARRMARYDFREGLLVLRARLDAREAGARA